MVSKGFKREETEGPLNREKPVRKAAPRSVLMRTVSVVKPSQSATQTGAKKPTVKAVSRHQVAAMSMPGNPKIPPRKTPKSGSDKKLKMSQPMTNDPARLSSRTNTSVIPKAGTVLVLPHRADGLNASFTKSNRLIEAKYSLPLNHMRLMMAILSKVKADQAIDDKTFYVVRPSDLTAAGTPAQRVRKTLREAEQVFKDCVIEIPSEDGSTIYTHWIQSLKINADGSVGFKFSNDIAPYVSDLKRNYTKVNLVIGALSTQNNIRLYEMVCRFRSTGIFSIGITELLSRLKITAKYGPKDVRRRILEPAVREITEKTDLDLRCEMLATKGRKLDLIKFFISEKTKGKGGTPKVNNQGAVELYTLTDKQTFHFAMLLHELPDFRSFFGKGQTTLWASMIPKIMEALNEPTTKPLYLPWLIKVGFDPHYAKTKARAEAGIKKTRSHTLKEQEALDFWDDENEPVFLD